MTHTIKGKKYELILTGTVGIVYLTQRMLGHQPEDGNPVDQCALLYTAMKTGNADFVNDYPNLDSFVAVMTSNRLTKLSNDFWAQWSQLEGEPDEDAEPVKDDKKGED